MSDQGTGIRAMLLSLSRDKAWVSPDEWERRVSILRARGLRDDIAHDLRWCGNPALLAQVERATDDDIATLNATHSQGA